MKKVAKFEKVSLNQFLKDYDKLFKFGLPKDIWEEIKLPKRATTGSAGYDFYSPFKFALSPGKTIIIPTGIRVNIKDGWFLQCVPKSGLGFKYRTQLDNTVGIIDADYYYSDNEGHIMAKVTNDSKKGDILYIDQGKAFMQGIFLKFGITEDDDADGIRNGGFGSTDEV